MAPLKPAGKLFIIILAALVLGGVYYVLQSNGVLNVKDDEERVEFNDNIPSNSNVEAIDKTFKIGVVTWPGYAGGQLFNGGFSASENSGFYKQYGFKVEFIVIDDFTDSRNAFKAGDLDLLWTTIDSYPTESAQLNAKLIFAADKSRGGDLIIATNKVRTINDLKNKEVAVALGTPSHTFLLWALEAAGMSVNDVDLVQVSSATDAAKTFKSGQVDAAVVWSPDDAECLAVVSGSHILTSTKEAGEIIVDAFMVREDILKQYPKELSKLVEGWLRGNAQINTNNDAKEKAIKILTAGLSVEESFIRTIINNVRYLTYGDNKVLFGLEPSQSAITGQELYTTMKSKYTAAGLSSYSTPSWNSVSTESILRSVNLSGPEHNPEQKASFKTRTVQEVDSAPILASKSISITFATGSYALDGNAKRIIREQFGPLLRAYPNLTVKLEGNTDNVGSVQQNMILSEQRARSVANFLIDEYLFDRNRFVVYGNGPNKPVDSNSTPEGRERNRRTDLILVY